VSRVSDAGACVEGLFIAEKSGVVDGDRSALQFPWRMEQKRASVPRQVRCGVVERQVNGVVTIERLCSDEDDPRCTRLVSLEINGKPRFPKQGG